MDLKKFIRDIPDFPKPGIIFKDITPLLKNSEAFLNAIEQLSAHFRDSRIISIAGVESRGFIIGAAMAFKLNCGFIPLRKPGKLPYKTKSVTYDLEYGTDTVEIHIDAVKEGEKVLLIDDLIATGGTAEAAVKLIARAGGNVTASSFVIELPELGGRQRLEALDIEVLSLCSFEGH